jgi:hypothetical protein
MNGIDDVDMTANSATERRCAIVAMCSACDRILATAELLRRHAPHDGLIGEHLDVVHEILEEVDAILCALPVADSADLYRLVSAMHRRSMAVTSAQPGAQRATREFDRMPERRWPASLVDLDGD